MAMVVNRWSTTPAINRQNVAEHSFFVALYTDHLCDMLGWPQPRKYQAIHWALIHDMPETVTSDMPGPVKRIVTNRPNLTAVEERLFKEFGRNYDHDRSDWQVMSVVKAANLIDEVFYLYGEQLLGNRYLDNVFQNSRYRMERALRSLNKCLARAPKPTDPPLSAVILDMVMNEMTLMKNGVVGLVDDSDLENANG